MYIANGTKQEIAIVVDTLCEEKKPRVLKLPASLLKRAAALAVAAVIAGAGFGFGYGANALVANTGSNGPEPTGYFTEQAYSGLNASQTNPGGYNPALLASSEANVSIVDVVKRTASSIVSINVSSTVTANNFFGRGAVEFESTSAGSGVIFYEDATKIYILTNFHVVEGANSVTITIDDLRQAPANYVGHDKSEDLAIISVLKTELISAGINDYTIATFGDSDQLEVGETVVAIGNAIGEGKSATAGIVSALNKHITIDGVEYIAIQTDATINPGNSGGALVNTSSEVIGINTAKISGNGVEGMGYSILSNSAKKVIDNIMTHGSTQKPYLGFEGSNITEELLAANLFLPGLGIYVSRVYQGAGAAVAGLRSNDIIVGANGATVETFDELKAMLDTIGVGGTIVLDVYRMDNSRNFAKLSLEAVIGDSNAGGGINF